MSTDDRPQQFKTREAELHEVRMRMHEENLDWVPNVLADNRDLRDAQLLGVALLRMKRPGIIRRHDMLEEMRSIG